MSRARLAEIDALRGAAALVVFFHHLRTLYPALDARLATLAPALHTLVLWVSARNVEAVLLFFVLSGFSIGASVERRGVDARAQLVDYYRRRGLRIVPLYVLSLLVSGVVAAWVAPVPTEALATRTLLGNLVFLQTATGTPGQWFVPYACNGALWSLSFEMFFYVTYPWLVRASESLAHRSLAVLAVSAVGLTWNHFAACPPAMFCAASLIWYFGVELAQLQLRQRLGLHAAIYAVLWLGFCVLRFGFGLIAFHGLAMSATLLWLGMGLQRVHMTAVVRGALTRLTRLAAPLARVGTFSYGLYLLHVPLLRACVALLGQNTLSVVCAVVTSFAIAYAAENVLSRFTPA